LIAAAPETHTAVRAALQAMGGEFAPFAFALAGVRATRGGATWAPAP
jgi:hypothetical protein